MQELRKNKEIQLNQQTIRCQVLADMIKIWSCLIFIKLYCTHSRISIERNRTLIVGLFGENILVISYKTIHLVLWDKKDYKTIKYNKDIFKDWNKILNQWSAIKTAEKSKSTNSKFIASKGQLISK